MVPQPVRVFGHRRCGSGLGSSRWENAGGALRAYFAHALFDRVSYRDAGLHRATEQSAGCGWKKCSLSPIGEGRIDPSFDEEVEHVHYRHQHGRSDCRGAHPLATRVFARHGIDYCCGGGRPLAEICDEKGLDIQVLLAEIGKELETPGASEERWDEAPIENLIEHILTAYHRPLDEELPRLESMARKVFEVHGDKDPERLGELLSVYVGLKMELEQHMAKEEQILFPMIKQGQGAMADGPISVMQDEHDSAASALRRLHELTNGFEVPEEACNTMAGAVAWPRRTGTGAPRAHPSGEQHPLSPGVGRMKS